LQAQRVFTPQIPSNLLLSQSYFQLECKEDELKDKMRSHFTNELKVDANEVIEKFLELKREDKGGKIRGTRPARAAN